MASKSLTFDIFGRDRTASKAIQGVGRSASGLTKVFAAVGAAIAAAFAVTRIVNFARTTVTEFAQAEASQAKLADAFERFPALIGGNIEAMRKLNTELAKKTRFDDDALASGQAVLAQYGLTQDQLTRLTPLLADYAAKTGKDVTTAATDLGKALLGSGRALKLIGVDFVDTGSVAGNFEQIMAALQAQVGGFAEKEGKTLIGQLEILKNAFGEVKESVGSLFAPAVGLLAGVINNSLIPVLAMLVEKYGPQMEQFFTSAATAAGSLLDKLGAALADGSIKDNLPQIAIAFAKLGAVLTEEKVLSALTELATKVLPPLADLLVTLAPLIPPIASAISTVLVPALTYLNQLLQGTSAYLSGNQGQMRSWAAQVLALPGPFGDALRAFAAAETALFNGVIDGVNTASAALQNFINIFARLGGMRITLPQLPHVNLGKTLGRGFQAAEGGFFSARPGGYAGVVGEGRDDEVVMPLNNKVYGQVGAGIAAAMGGSGGGGGTQVTIHMAPGSVISSQREAVKWFADAFDQVSKRGGVPMSAFTR